MIPVVAGVCAAACAVLFVGTAVRSRRGRPELPAPPPVVRPASARPSVRYLVAGSLAVLCLLGPAPAPILAPVVGLVAWRGPVFVAGRAARRRRVRADAEIPQLLDLLAAASSAGLSASLSLRHRRAR